MFRRRIATGISISTLLVIVALVLGVVALLGYSPLLMVILAVIALALAMLL